MGILNFLQKNLVNNELNDFTTVYDLADGDAELIFPFSSGYTINVNITAGSFTYKGASYGTNLTGTLDATVDFSQSPDGENEQPVSDATQLVLDAAQKLGGWEEREYEGAYGHILIAQNTVSAGTVRVLLTYKAKQ